MHKTKPGIQQYASFCITINQTPLEINPTPFFVHAYNAYSISQETDDSSQPTKHKSQTPDSPKQPVPPTDTGLSKTQQDLLCLHHQYGHIGVGLIQDWACRGKFNLS